MKTIITDRGTLENISHLELKAYLIAQGWSVGDKIGDKAVILIKEGINDELVLPLRKDLGDFVLRISELLDMLSNVENRSMISIVGDINKSGVDIIRVRMIEGTDDGSISLSKTADVFYNSKEMLCAAACVVSQQPKKVYGSRKAEDVINYLDRIRIGQTEYGSFVLTFLSPVAPKLTSKNLNLFRDMDIENDPFERLANKMLLKSLHATKNAAINALSNGEMESFEESVSLGVSANLCDAIANIVKKVGETEISVSWAKTRPVLEQFDKQTINFDRPIAELIEEAARTFKLSEPQPNQQVIGWVYQLKQEQNSDPEGTIGVNTIINNKSKKLKIILSQEDYQKATIAHATGKFISLEGDLYLRGKLTELRNPRNLNIVKEAEESDLILSTNRNP